MEKKRQYIILSVMVIAIVYGAVELLSARSGKASAPAAKTDLQSFIAQTMAGIGKDTASPYDAYVVSQAGKEWTRNPFAHSTLVADLKRAKSDKAAKPQFVYQGFIDGPRKVAIINNVEYTPGEAMEQEGFFVKAISPSLVVIENRKGRTEIKVPLSE